ncbi:hypothetical protein NE686_00315 [Tissierella carlieri]|uniref:Uncharacterized protein n=1 Tax=Tissierella carlieri TaxID=689904 RepID=A0ABT1S4W8_9FIRM|nr:hypothetical protein [Tissierella carlieri]MCQ4921511.1 hypothetical protein [Tissierella carlieri]
MKIGVRRVIPKKLTNRKDKQLMKTSANSQKNSNDISTDKELKYFKLFCSFDNLLPIKDYELIDKYKKNFEKEIEGTDIEKLLFQKEQYKYKLNVLEKKLNNNSSFTIITIAISIIIPYFLLFSNLTISIQNIIFKEIINIGTSEVNTTDKLTFLSELKDTLSKDISNASTSTVTLLLISFASIFIYNKYRIFKNSLDSYLLEFKIASIENQLNIMNNEQIKKR